MTSLGGGDRPLRELPIRLGDVTKDNWQQLRRLNISILPVHYGDKFYRETVKDEVRAVTKLAYHHDIVIAAVSARFEPTGAGTRRMYIMTLGVLAPYRHYGVGSKLLNVLIAYADAHADITQLTLHVQTSNAEAIAFYNKFGFVVSGRIDGYYKKLSSPDADCYSADMSLLTENGFLSLNEYRNYLSTGQVLRFACYNPTTQQIEYHVPTAVIVKPSPCRLVEFTSTRDGQSEWDEAVVDEYSRMSDECNTGNDRSGHISVMVTPEHDMWALRGKARPGRAVIWEGKPYAKYTAASLRDQVDGFDTCCFQTSSPAGVSPILQDTPQLIMKALSLKTDEQFNAFLELFGFWIGDGCLKSQPAAESTVQKPYSVSFTQRTQSDRDWLHKQLRLCGLVEGLSHRARRAENSLSEQFDVIDPSWVTFFFKEYDRRYPENYESPIPPITVDDETAMTEQDIRELEVEAEAEIEENGFQPDLQRALLKSLESAKWFPKWVSFGLTMDQTRRVLEGYRRADRSWTKSNYVVYTSSVTMRDQLITLCLHAGYSPHFRLEYGAGEVRGCTSLKDLADFRKMSAAQKKTHGPLKIQSASHYNQLSEEEKAGYSVIRATADAWKVSSRSDVYKVAIRHAKGEVVNKYYEGEVWCVTVPTGLVIAQRAYVDGSSDQVTHVSRPVICGNCFILTKTMHQSAQNTDGAAI